MVALRLLSLHLGLLVPALAVKGDGGPTGTEDYFWPKRGGTYIGHGAVPYKVPVDFSKKPAWTWDNPNDELFRHGPVIDGQKNIYAVTSCGWIRKFDQDGKLLWSFQLTAKEGKTVTSPFLYKGKLFLTSMGEGSTGWFSMAHCFDMETGERLWRRPAPGTGHVNHDSSTIHVAEDVMLGAMTDNIRPAPYEGNNMIYAMNATDGANLWQFTMDRGVLWNFMPSTPGDGSFFFASSCGVAQRRRLSDGGVIWKSPLPQPHNGCSTGGATLGPNGVFYVEANHVFHNVEAGMGDSPAPGVVPCSVLGCPEGAGVFVAHSAEDGKVLWSRRMGTVWSGMQYPTVGEIDGRLVVAAGIGQNPALPQFVMGEKWWPTRLGILVARLQVEYVWLRRLLGVAKATRNGVEVLDAKTGATVWLWEEEPWEFYAAKGDEGAVFQRRVYRSMEQPMMEPVCGPDNWGIPAIAADGTVIAASGSSGKLYAIRDANGDGRIQDSEVSTFDAEQAFLNGPALAPGLMAVAPCWGPMYVFKSDAQ